ncbi:MAG TPA: Asp-tRNA(Asn)/Glu-tRNA(Gln) amidotransferase subunit GatB [Tenericutes bacterium]|nr:Asp-tRNA(Asn)/Glu-tRNA(Gln) amidotransferase subunit GatB [Mycoplasmatota bacterium]
MLVPTIGVEVHVELKSNTKVFSSSLNAFDNEPNKYVSVIDLGYPGTLPKLNKEVINMALSAAIALNCKINKVMHFDRKNYFYPDLPKGYQITQNKTPIGYDGYLEIEINGKKKKIGIERIQIEEDTCKSIHVEGKTLLNANRAGVPLIEVVSKPVIETGEEAALYLEKLREILLYLGISDVKIEEGSMRCDANISLKEHDSPEFGTKIEIKNIGSISHVKTSIEYEEKRQKELLLKGEILKEETRRFDEKTLTTVLMRTKETGNDYRYFPEPDIPYVVLSEEWISEIKNNMPILADELKEKYRKLGINENNIKTIISNISLCKFFETVVDKTNPISAANILTSEVLGYLNKNYIKISDMKLNQDNFIKLIEYINIGKISSKQAKDIIPVLIEKELSIDQVISELKIEQISDENILLEIINKIIDLNPNAVNDFKDGKYRAVKFLMGQIMKETKGQASPQILNKLLTEELSKR